METSAVQAMKLAVMSASGLSRDALHLYVGMAVFLIVALLFRKPLRSIVPLLAVVLIAVAIEALDATDDLRSFGHWRVGASLHDIANTLFWPAVLFLLSRFSRRFRTACSGKAG